MAGCNYDSDSSRPISPSKSQASSNTRYEWDLLEGNINNQAIISFQKNKMPPHKMYGSQKINCSFCEKGHKMKRNYFKCMCECPVKYKIDYCVSCSH